MIYTRSCCGVKGEIVKKVWVICVLFIVIFCFIFWKKTKTNITVILPEKCEFFVDENLSSSFHNNFVKTVTEQYTQTKNPKKVMDNVTQQFPEVHVMQAQICKTDKICFYVDAAKPVFLLNDQFVICDNAVQINKDHYTLEIIQDLIKVSSDQVINLENVIQFIQSLPNIFKQNFRIVWLSDSNILLTALSQQQCQLLTSMYYIPQPQDLNHCQLIAASLPKASKNKKKCVTYDLRFKNQIIIR